MLVNKAITFIRPRSASTLLYRSRAVLPRQITRLLPATVLFNNGKNFSVSSQLMVQNTTMNFCQKNCDLSYEDILNAQKDSSVLMIDVREEDEINQTGALPGSIHIPMANVSNILSSLSKQEFKERFGKDKPTKETKIILTCRSGRRSATVQEQLHKLGYENSYNYLGGWLDWESHQKGES